MKEQILDEELARRFLLGQLSPEEQGRIEELAFTDPQSFAFLEAAEDDLIDEFVYDDLSYEERDSFQKHFLAQPGRREHLRMARALQHNLERDEPTPRSLWERLRQWFYLSGLLIPATVGAALVVVAGLGLYVIRKQTSNPPPQLAEQHPSPLPTPTSTASQTPIQSSPSPSPSPKGNENKTPQPAHRPASPIYAMLDPGGSVRSEGAGDKEVSLSSNLAGFELPLVSDKSYRSYDATLKTNGRVMKTWSKLTPTRSGSIKVIRLSLPSNQLQGSQRYQFALDGLAANGDIQHVADYFFRTTN
jgi:hypothetical protein